METFVKNHPGKSFDFYYEQAEKIDNDPTCSIDGEDRTPKRRILENIQHNIKSGEYTYKDIGITPAHFIAALKAEKPLSK